MDYFEQFQGIRNVHLSSGEDIIGEVEFDGKVLTVKNPVIPQVMRNPTNPTQATIGLTEFRPWLSELKKIDLDREKVMFAAKVDDAMEKAYRQQFSVIDIVPASAMPTTPTTGRIKL